MTGPGGRAWRLGRRTAVAVRQAWTSRRPVWSGSSRGTSLLEALIAIVVLSVGLGSVASLTRTSASALVRARALDETHAALQSFIDSAAASGAGPSSGSRDSAFGTLSWSVPAAPGAEATARFEHDALPEPVEFAFAVRADP